MGETALIIGLRILRIDPDQKIIIQNRALEVAGGAMGLGPVLNRADMARSKTDGLTEIADGTIGIPFFEIDQSAAKKAVDFFGIDFDCAIEIRDGGIDVTLCAMRFGTAAEGGGEPVKPPAGGLNVSVACGDRCCRRRFFGQTNAPGIVLGFVLCKRSRTLRFALLRRLLGQVAQRRPHAVRLQGVENADVLLGRL
jgi:hypothetical protein